MTSKINIKFSVSTNKCNRKTLLVDEQQMMYLKLVEFINNGVILSITKLYKIKCTWRVQKVSQI